MSRKQMDPTLATYAPPTTGRPWGGMLLSLVGLAMAAAGPLALFGPDRVSQLTPLADFLATYDLRPDILFGCGLVLVGLGRIASYQYRNTNILLEPGIVAHDLEQVDAGLRELQSRMKELRDEQGVTRERLAGMSRQVSEHRDVSAAGHENAQNALFRLAASLDQLGANIEHSVQGSAHEVQERIIEGNQLTEASRDFVTESIEETGRELAHYVYEVVTSVGGPRPAMHPTFAQHPPAQPGAGREPAAAAEPESTEFDATAYSSAVGYTDTSSLRGNHAEDEQNEDDHELPEVGLDQVSEEADGDSDEAEEADSPLGLLDKLDDPSEAEIAGLEELEAPAPEAAAQEMDPPTPPAPLNLEAPPATIAAPDAPLPTLPIEPAEGISAPPTLQVPGAAGPPEDHQPLPTVIQPLNPRDPRNLNN